MTSPPSYTGGQTGQWMTEPEGHRWWFDTGSQALDLRYASLINTADLAAWISERFDRVDPRATDRDLADAQALAEAIAQIAPHHAQLHDERPPRALSGAIDILNLYAALPDIPPRMPGGRRQAGATRTRISAVLATLARDAVTLFTQAEPGRIRECAADECDYLFADASRSNNRRWCSMQRCGNRQKVRAHRRRANSGSGDEGRD